MRDAQNLENIGAELDEHLDAINQNTSEIANVYEFLGELDMKIDKLSERIDALQTLMLAQTPSKRKMLLSPKERSILHVLLDATEPVLSSEIAKKVCLTPDIVAQSLYCLNQKDIPVLAQSADGQTFYALDEEFRKKHKINCF